MFTEWEYRRKGMLTCGGDGGYLRSRPRVQGRLNDVEAGRYDGRQSLGTQQRDSFLDRWLLRQVAAREGKIYNAVRWKHFHECIFGTNGKWMVFMRSTSLFLFKFIFRFLFL
ncbi:hypothetical protein CEXT_658771 [Caerostris extrusa]|uniref:Uncharacterized protein n=1 Tax=Caerostris extrusa TaxID=172846 RepID=A0AAV4XR25_CAEEX|nr:hypothetical protein CEXT_658771 [Caerostris extrusa]